MAYYTALISKWGTLSGTTQSKLDQINALTVTGSVPTTFYTTGAEILNCIDWTEFNALTAERQTNLLQMCAIPGQLLGGSAQTSHLVAGMIIAYFNIAGPTVAALTALAKATVTPWWQAPVANGGGGLVAPVQPSDLSQNGLS